ESVVPPPPAAPAPPKPPGQLSAPGDGGLADNGLEGRSNTAGRVQQVEDFEVNEDGDVEAPIAPEPDQEFGEPTTSTTPASPVSHASAPSSPNASATMDLGNAEDIDEFWS